MKNAVILPMNFPVFSEDNECDKGQVFHIKTLLDIIYIIIIFEFM